MKVGKRYERKKNWSKRKREKKGKEIEERKESIREGDASQRKEGGMFVTVSETK